MSESESAGMDADSRLEGPAPLTRARPGPLPWTEEDRGEAMAPLEGNLLKVNPVAVPLPEGDDRSIAPFRYPLVCGRARWDLSTSGPFLSTFLVLSFMVTWWSGASLVRGGRWSNNATCVVLPFLC